MNENHIKENCLKLDHLTREWEQAWNHYRHLESGRVQYLGFFFTAVVASVGLTVGFLKDVKPQEQAAVLFGLYILSEFLFLITIGLFTAIKKTGCVLARYDIIMNSVRKDSGFESSEKYPFNLSDMKDYRADIFDLGVFSVQKSAEFILGVSTVILFLILSFGMLYFFFTSTIGFHIWQQLLSLLMTIGSTIYFINVFRPLYKDRVGRKKNKGGKSATTGRTGGMRKNPKRGQ